MLRSRYFCFIAMHQCEELRELKEEYEQHKEISAQIEAELEAQVKLLQASNEQLERQAEALQARLEACSRDAQQLERELAAAQAALKEAGERLLKANKRSVSLENEVEHLAGNLRAAESLLMQRDAEIEKLQEEIIIEKLEHSVLKEKLEEAELNPIRPAQNSGASFDRHPQAASGEGLLPARPVLEGLEAAPMQDRGTREDKKTETVDLELLEMRRSSEGTIASIASIMNYIELSQVISVEKKDPDSGAAARNQKRPSLLFNDQRFRQEYRRVSRILLAGDLALKIPAPYVPEPESPRTPAPETAPQAEAPPADALLPAKTVTLEEPFLEGFRASAARPGLGLLDKINEQLSDPEQQSSGSVSGTSSKKSSSIRDSEERRRVEKLNAVFSSKKNSPAKPPPASSHEQRKLSVPTNKSAVSPYSNRYPKTFVEKICKEDELIDDLLAKIDQQISASQKHDKKISESLLKAESLMKKVENFEVKATPIRRAANKMSAVRRSLKPSPGSLTTRK